MMRTMRLCNYVSAYAVRLELPFARPPTLDQSNVVEPTNWATAHTNFARVKIVLDSKLVFAFSFKAYF